VRRTALDLILLFGLVAGFAVLVRLLAFPVNDYFVYAGLLVIFLVPGWLIAPSLIPEDHRQALLVRFSFAFFLSYLVYGVIGLICRGLGLGLEVFAWVYSVVIAATALWSSIRRQPSRAKWSVRVEDVVVGLALLVAIVFFFQLPYNNDGGISHFNVNDTGLLGTFQPSALDIKPFGYDEAQPRFQANLLHAFHGAFAYFGGMLPEGVSIFIAQPFLGFFLIAALFTFIRTIVGKDVHYAFILLAILAPVTFFYEEFRHYLWYSFQFLNSPGLDKHFSRFILIPGFLTFVVLFLKEGKLRAFSPLLLAGPVLAYSHPVTAIYLVMGTGVLGLALFRRERLRRVFLVGAVALATLGLVTIAFDLAGMQKYATIIAEFDFKTYGRDGMHLGSVHLVLPDEDLGANIVLKDGVASLKNHMFLQNALIRYSVIATVIWLLLHVLMRQFGRAGAVLENEKQALVIQLIYVGSLGALILVINIMLNNGFLGLHRGLERLHWYYLGFFSFVYLGVYAEKGGTLVLEQLARRFGGLSENHRRMAATVPAVLLTLHLADQSAAIRFGGPTVLSAAGISRSAADKWVDGHRGVGVVDFVDAVGAYRNGSTFPPWMRDDDKVLVFSPPRGMSQWKREIDFRSVYYREVMAEGMAYKKMGDPFFDWYVAYSDAQDGHATTRLVKWMKERGVTLILTTNSALVKGLSDLGGRIVQEAQSVYRLHGWREVRR